MSSSDSKFQACAYDVKGSPVAEDPDGWDMPIQDTFPGQDAARTWAQAMMCRDRRIERFVITEMVPARTGAGVEPGPVAEVVLRDPDKSVPVVIAEHPVPNSRAVVTITHVPFAGSGYPDRYEITVAIAGSVGPPAALKQTRQSEQEARKCANEMWMVQARHHAKAAV